jgi:hypothetical protein
MTRVSVVVPFGADVNTIEGQHRARLWNFIRPLWQDLIQRGVVHELIVEDDPLRGSGAAWSTARALRQAVPKATGEIVTHFGADHLPDEDVLLAVKSILSPEGASWVSLYQDVAYASERTTGLLLNGVLGTADLVYDSWAGCCVGMWAWKAEVWAETGGVDPRFVGWGFGDTAWNRVLEATYGPSPTPPGKVLRELWHPATYRGTSGANPNHDLYYSEYDPITGNKDALLRMKEKWGG